jgi:SAM-dependent methyltransferase
VSDADSLRSRVESFSRWHYEFDLGHGVRTPNASAGQANRHRQRKEYFFTPLVKLCGGTLAGRRVLDLGCNAGYWSLAAIEAGADFVLGIDGRQMHIDQANLVFEAKGVDPSRYRFDLADIFALDLHDEMFDIVLCLGLLYHVSKPFELMERMSRWNTDLLVIDTTLETDVAGAYFRIVQQNLDDPRAALDRPVALHPTWRAVVRLAEQYGYACVVLRPQFTSWHGAKRYRVGSRRAFLCAKRSPLSTLAAGDIEAEPPAPPARARRALNRRVAGRARRLLRKFNGRAP